VIDTVDTPPVPDGAGAGRAWNVQEYRKRDAYLRTQVEPYRTHWKEISENILPRARFMPFETNRGDKKFLAIVNNVASLALRTATAGMVAGLTSPARQWHHLTTSDPAMAALDTIRTWLHTVEERQRAVFSKSNLYQALAAFYFDLLAFGTALIIIDEDDESVLRAYHVPIGSYRLASSARGRPDTVFRDLTFSVRQCVQKFGADKCSERVKRLYDQKEFDQPVDVTHVIEPNEDYEPGKLNAKLKKYRSVWFENPGGSTGASPTDSGPVSGGDDKFLLESGFQEQRALAARWMVIGEDVYATTCPGMEALGDSKAITTYEKEKAKLIELLGGPPVAVPHGMNHVSLLPRKISNLPAGAQNAQVRSIIDQTHLPSAIQATREAINEHGARINRTLYADLWQMLTLGDQGGVQPKTAEEIRARMEEKLIQLAPVLLRLNDELLQPLIDVAFAIMWRAGLIPDPPEELHGVELKVEFVSMLHQAQQFVQLGGIERLAGFVVQFAETRPDALEKLNIDNMVDEYAKTLGVTPNLILSDDEVAKVRDARAKQQQAAAAAQAVQVGADAAHKLGNTPMTEDTALSRLAGLTGPLEPSGAAGVAPGAQA
jgi:predicted small integral membrane protein